MKKEMQSWSGRLLCLYSTILGPSSSPFQSIARCRAEAACGFRDEKKHACLVLLSLNPPAHRPYSMIDLQLEELPVWNMFFPIQRNLCQRTYSWIDCNSIFVPLGSSEHSILGLSVERLSASILFSLSKHVSTILLQQLHDNLPCRKIFVRCLAMCLNSQPLLCFAEIICQFRGLLNPIDISSGIGEALYLTGDCSPCVCPRGRPQLDD